ncbi:MULTISPECIES: RDD family protein [Bacillaceae]|uniref:RDD family protein n=1 Tax=Evansella alkalicola TaxID=745819 RepID=A0ABS6K0M4_9BACI|nr:MULTISPECIES: RDD family protein [Bacillaceae]MBU9723012.1 RDD family protein [Bacillus alkalicola]
MNVVTDSPVGIVERFVAMALDLIIVFAIAFFLSITVYNGESFISFLFVSAVILSYLNTIFLPLLWNGYTLGKRIIGIRIEHVAGQRLTLLTMLIRELLIHTIYSATFGIVGVVSALFVSKREDKRSIHDLLAKTYVTSNLPEAK